MRHAAVLALALFAGCAQHLGATIPAVSVLNAVPAFSETQACSGGTCAGSVPTSTSNGMQLYGVQGFRLTVCAPSGQTLSGAGTMQAYLCDAAKSVCSRNKGLDVTVNASSVRCQVFPDFTVGVVPWADSTVEFVASGVTVSSGTPLTVYLDPGGPK